MRPNPCRCPTCLHIVAQRDDEIIGVILVKEFWNLCSLFVSQECQRQGIGRKLVLAAIEGCRSSSPKQAINLNSSPRAVAFYKSLGFVHRESSQPLPPGSKPMKLVLSVSEANRLFDTDAQGRPHPRHSDFLVTGQRRS